MSDKPEKIKIVYRGVGGKGDRNFFQLIQKYILEGYRIADNQMRADLSRRSGSVVLYLEGKDPHKASDWGVPSATYGVKVVVCANAGKAEPTPEVEAEVVETPEVEVVETPEVKAEPSKDDVLAKIESATKKQDLLAIAVDLKVAIPENIKQPAAIQKYLRENV